GLGEVGLCGRKRRSAREKTVALARERNRIFAGPHCYFGDLVAGGGIRIECAWPRSLNQRVGARFNFVFGMLRYPTIGTRPLRIAIGPGTTRDGLRRFCGGGLLLRRYSTAQNDSQCRCCRKPKKHDDPLFTH